MRRSRAAAARRESPQQTKKRLRLPTNHQPPPNRLARLLRAAVFLKRILA
jgi:hypothetical protein